MTELETYIRTEISNKWNFQSNPLFNDIPIAISETSSNLKSVYMPLEVFDEDDFDTINNRIKESESVYILDENNKVESVTMSTFDILDYTNVTLIESNFNWIINISIVFTGIGEAISFGGKEMIDFVKNNFQEKAEWIAEW